jgi:osmotically-inducible protein OsmY
MIRPFSPASLALLAILAATQLSGCAGALIGAGAAGGVTAMQEGGLEQAGTDTRIQAQINDLWFKHDTDMFRKLDMTVDQGRVLITGVVQKQEHRVEAVRLAWQVKGVKQVINEIKIANSEGVQGYVRDTWITTQLRSKLTFDRQVRSINYNIDTVQATIYLMGQGRNQTEVNRVIEIARTIKGVKGVVSYVKLVGQKTNVDRAAVDQQNYGAQGQSFGTPTSLSAEESNDISQDFSGPAAPVAPIESVEREETSN